MQTDSLSHLVFFFTSVTLLIIPFHLFFSLRFPCFHLHLLTAPLCNQAHYHTFLTSLCLLLSLSPSVSHLCYKAVISAVQCALPPLSPSLSLLSCLPYRPAFFTLSPRLPSLSLTHSPTKQLTALYMLISPPQSPLHSSLFSLPSLSFSHIIFLSWGKSKSSTSLVDSFVFKLSVYSFSQLPCANICILMSNILHTLTHLNNGTL